MSIAHSAILPTPQYEGLIEERFQARTRKRFYRYVIVTDEGQPLFDGYAGDLKEANDTIKAHIRRLRLLAQDEAESAEAVLGKALTTFN